MLYEKNYGKEDQMNLEGLEQEAAHVEVNGKLEHKNPKNQDSVHVNVPEKLEHQNHKKQESENVEVHKSKDKLEHPKPEKQKSESQQNDEAITNQIMEDVCWLGVFVPLYRNCRCYDRYDTKHKLQTS